MKSRIYHVNHTLTTNTKNKSSRLFTSVRYVVCCVRWVIASNKLVSIAMGNMLRMGVELAY